MLIVEYFCFLRVGEQLRHLNISWLNQVPAAKHSPMSGHAMADMIFNKCPRVTELDLSGTKTLHAVNVQQLLDAKTQQVFNLCMSVFGILTYVRNTCM